jgi:hypothetical protein
MIKVELEVNGYKGAANVFDGAVTFSFPEFRAVNRSNGKLWRVSSITFNESGKDYQNIWLVNDICQDADWKTTRQITEILKPYADKFLSDPEMKAKNQETDRITQRNLLVSQKKKLLEELVKIDEELEKL